MERRERVKSATIMASEVFHTSGTTCLSVARWCEGECSKARKSQCFIWDAGDCNASLPARTRHITLNVTDIEYEWAVQNLREAGIEVK